MTDDDHDRLRMNFAEPLDLAHRAELRVSHELAAGDGRAAAEGVEPTPSHVGVEGVQCLPGPLPEVDLGEGVVYDRGEAVRKCDRVGRLARALEWARVHG